MTSASTDTKAARVKRLLKRKRGASIDDVTAETGWQPHSVRAFLTGLRKKGHTLVREQNADGATSYRIAEDAISDNGGDQ